MIASCLQACSTDKPCVSGRPTVYYNKIPIYPMFYLLKGDHMSDYDYVGTLGLYPHYIRFNQGYFPAHTLTPRYKQT